jgi:hypothetical protein
LSHFLHPNAKSVLTTRPVDGRVLYKGNLKFPVSSSLGLSPPGDGLAEPLLKGLQSLLRFKEPVLSAGGSALPS